MELRKEEYIYNEEQGIGKILDVDVISGDKNNPEYEVRFFVGKEYIQKKMTSNYIRNSYTVKLDPSSFLVLAFNDPLKANELIKHNHSEVIYLTLLDFKDHQAKTDQLRHHLRFLIPDWDKWWIEAKSKIKKDPRIDRSQSSRQIFSIAKEYQSLAEQYYALFEKEKTSGRLEKAIRYGFIAIEKQQEGETLSLEQINTIENFLKTIIHSKKYDQNLRLRVYFNLVDLNLWDQTIILSDLIELDIPLYQYEPDVGKRISMALYQNKNNLNTKEKFLLITGIAATKKTIDIVEQWFLEEKEPTIFLKLIEYGFRENLPNKENLNNKSVISCLSRRINSISKIILNMRIDLDEWNTLYEHFRYFISWVNDICKTQIDYSILTETVGLVVALQGKWNELGKHSNWQVYLELTSKKYQKFWLRVIELKSTQEILGDFVNKIIPLLEENLHEDNIELYLRLIKENNKNPSNCVEAIFKSLPKLTTQSMKEEFGKCVYEIAINSSYTEKLKLLPYLDFLRVYDDNQYSWKSDVDILRQQLYWQMIHDNQHNTAYRDEILVNAFYRFSEEKNAALLNELTELKNNYQIELEKNEKLSKKIGEMDQVISELRGLVEISKEQSEFQSQKRILLDLIHLVVEVERYILINYASFEDLRAITWKFLRLMKKYHIESIGEINQQVRFDPKIHKVLASEDVKDGDWVSIEERGFVIHTPEGKSLVLKPAIVKKRIV
ncbi:nucleotide exchange factor GrpE [Bellilinea sp.]|uniref:nucleotide exchange factor GrpE n=1 Tax=Bellilinea sp. TaxID=2838785 RepID=UPI002ADDB98A|nr:nucleotide exchange factor GrpE [Bellilinea sp.]